MDFFDNDTVDELNSTLTDESQFLPADNYDTKSDKYHEKLRQEELELRLKNSQDKIDSYEELINNISDECLKIDLNSNGLLNFNKSFHETDVDAKNVISYIQEYIFKLEEEFKSLDDADSQIENATDKVIQEIDKTYDKLLTTITNEINKKRDILKLEANVFKNENLTPLKACRQQIKNEILKKKSLINEIELKLNNNVYHKNSELNDLHENSGKIGGIPAVPSIDELPYLNFKNPTHDEIHNILNCVYDVGSIIKLGPVKITDVQEKPGCIYVKWNIDDPDFANDEYIYLLQKANGEIIDQTSDEFVTVYEGTDNYCFINDFQFNQVITLRVGIKSFETAWSAPRIAKTNITFYGWSQENKDYMITNNGTIAAKLVDKISTLYSKSAQLDGNQIIEFKFLEVPKNASNNEGIALLNEPNDCHDNLIRDGSLFITSQGKIFMDGNEKSMQLPTIESGVTVLITLLKKDDETLRINIECSDKIVTYDWCIDTPLYFATRLAGHRWNLMVK